MRTDQTSAFAGYALAVQSLASAAARNLLALEMEHEPRTALLVIEASDDGSLVVNTSDSEGRPLRGYTL